MSNLAMKICLGLLALLVSGPFLLPVHTAPLASFWSEWWAAALGLGAVVTGIYATRDRVQLPSLLLMPALLLLVLLFQFALERQTFPRIGLLYAVYLLWAGLLLVLGRQIAFRFGLPRLADVLASAIVFGTMVSAAIALVQWLGIADLVPGVFPNPNGSIYANLGQRNHLAHYFWLGIASAFYLHGREKISRRLLWLLIIPISFGSVLGGSRSVFIYAMVLFFIVAWSRYREPSGPAAKLVADTKLLLPVLVVMNVFGAWASPLIPDFWSWLGVTLHPSEAMMPYSRLFAEVATPSLRLAILRTAWVAFEEYPWLGQGAGNFSWASFIVSSDQTDDAQFAVAEHAHNFVFQLLAEFGAPAALAVIVLLGLWARQFCRQHWKLEHIWCASILGIGCVHSLLEYPLWYSYFLGPTALLLGATDIRNAIELDRRRIRLYLLLAAISGALIFANLRADYSTIEAASYRPLAAHPDRETAWKISMDRLLVLYKESLLSPWALMAFTNLSEPSRDLAQERSEVCKRGIRFAPARTLIVRCAMQLAIAGRGAEAKNLAQDVQRAYPDERAETVEELRKGAQNFSEIQSLWGLSNRN